MNEAGSAKPCRIMGNVVWLQRYVFYPFYAFFPRGCCDVIYSRNKFEEKNMFKKIKD